MAGRRTHTTMWQLLAFQTTVLCLASKFNTSLHNHNKSEGGETSFQVRFPLCKSTKVITDKQWYWSQTGFPPSMASSHLWHVVRLRFCSLCRRARSTTCSHRDAKNLVRTSSKLVVNCTLDGRTLPSRRTPDARNDLSTFKQLH